MKIAQNIKSTVTLWRVMILASVAAPALSHGQVVIGGWQNNTGDGWTDSSDVSITNAANMPAKYEFETGVVSGYTQSLGIHETGFGNARLKINLTGVSGALAAFTNGTKMQFTFSCPPDSGAGAGYMQLVQFQYNSPGSGFQQVTSGWTNSFSATGSTNNNSATGQPVFFFSPGSSARSQVVTWDYSQVKSNIMSAGISYLQLTFVFQTGGGAPTNVLMNNVVLLGPPAPPTATTNIIVDDFVSAGVSSSNPANYDYYSSAQVYSSGQITNVWGNWFGGAFSSVLWDSATDASNNPASGSMRVDLNWSNGSQFVMWDQGTANNFFALNISGLQFTNFQCDVKFAPGSASSAGTFGQPMFGHLRFGDRTSGYGQDWFGAVDIAATNTGWVHVSIPLNAIADPNLTNILGLIIGIDSGFYSLTLSGASTFWVDNIKFSGPVAVVSNPPPVLSLQKATPGLRVFAGSTVNTYDREELATVDTSQSWIGGTYPVTYSFKLLSAPSLQGWQTHMFLIPTSPAPSGGIYNNEYIDYQAANSLWLQINGSSNGTCTANVSWKTNLPNANPNQVAVNITNSTPVGTWKVTFNNANSGTLTAPGASPVAFTINDPTVSTDFANPLVAIFGIQPQSTAYYGSYVDYASINISGVAGSATSDDFTTASSLGANWDITDSAYANSIVLVTADNPYWVSWTLPDFGFGLGVAPNLTTGQWMLPEFYNNYNDGNNVPITRQEGTKRWSLIPAATLPTVDATQGGVLSPNAYYRLFNPPLVN
ncbi:hypothetical protein [Pedosphaera parvula]|uniref:Uncharacterized protein n=1 Tax=Pedosphaera parvula (strain Ellin514) TaxID=320771 RepID=B9XH37_PEDPL|nr:hypothetical protein [Pedosphaera parvula]EEF60958.1 hypothetical protein Cflav_PD4127 [Pedosphaera parvula Ellin514]